MPLFAIGNTRYSRSRVRHVLGLVAASGARAQRPPEPAAGFHHVHMNVVDPERSIACYVNAFEQTRKTKVAAWDAVQSESVYVLFNKVPEPASAGLETLLWPFGWNSPNVAADDKRRAAKGVVFLRVPQPSRHHHRSPGSQNVEIAPAAQFCDTNGGPSSAPS